MVISEGQWNNGRPMEHLNNFQQNFYHMVILDSGSFT